MLLEVAAGVSFLDLYRRSGVYPMTHPSPPGTEGAGRVLAVGLLLLP